MVANIRVAGKVNLARPVVSLRHVLVRAWPHESDRPNSVISGRQTGRPLVERN